MTRDDKDKTDNPAGETKPTQTRPRDWSEETNRRAARASTKAAGAELEEELEEGLDDTFPASDPPSATRPGAGEEDRKEKKDGEPS